MCTNTHLSLSVQISYMYSMCRCAQCCSILPLTLPWTAGQPPDLHLIDHQLPTEQQSAGRKQIKGAALVVATVKHGGFRAMEPSKYGF